MELICCYSSQLFLVATQWIKSVYLGLTEEFFSIQEIKKMTRSRLTLQKG